MTYVVLIVPDSPFLIDPLASFPPLGVMYLSQYLANHGHACTIIDLTGREWTRKDEVYMAAADVVGITSTTPQFPGAVEILKKVKKRNHYATTVIGGAHALHSYSCLDAGFHYVVQYDGEKPLLALTEMKRSPLRGLVKTGQVLQGNGDMALTLEDMDFVPYRHKSLLDRYRYKKDGVRYTNMIASRGCAWGKCAFCVKNYCDPVRWRTADSIINEMKRLRDVYGYEGIYFFDDTFNKMPEFKKFCDLAGHLEMKWRALIRADIKEVQAFHMKHTGCAEVFIGQESGSNRILKNIHKGITRQQGLRAIQHCHNAGLTVRIGLIIGLPGESRETVQETRTFLQEARKIDPELTFDYTYCTIYPGSPIWNNPDAYDIELHFDKKWLDFTDPELFMYKRKSDSPPPPISTSSLTSEEIKELHNEVVEDFADMSWERQLEKGRVG